MAFGNIGTIWASIGLETTKLQMGVSTAKMQLSALDRQAMTQTASINAKLNNIGAGLTSVGKNMSKFVTLPLLAIGVAATKAGMDFEKGMTESLAIMNNVTPQIRSQMELTAKDIIKYTTFSAKEGADAFYFLASAGLTAAESIKVLPVVARFAQAGVFDLARATEFLTDAQSALGLKVKNDVVKNMENMVRVSDVLVKANVLSNATVQQFAESLTNKAGAALKMLNKDVEEGVAVLAAWADQGVKGAEAGNYLNIVFRDLQRAAITNEEVFDQFNISVFDSTGKVRNMADIIGDLETALDTMSDKEKRATLMMLGFQDRSISAMMSLLGTSDSIRTYEKELRSATGYTEDVAKKQMESFAAQVKQLKNELINVGISIFDILKPRLESLIDWVKKAIDWFDNLTDTQKSLIVNLGIFAAAIGPVAYALSGLTKIVVFLRTAIIGLTIANRGLIGTIKPFTAIATATILMAEGLDRLTAGMNKYGSAVLRSIIYPHSEALHGIKLNIEAIKGLKDGTLEWSDVLKMSRFDLEDWAKAHREGTEATEESTEAVGEQTDAMGYYSTVMMQDIIPATLSAKIATQDHENAVASLTAQYPDLTEAEVEYMVAVEEAKEVTEEGTGAIDEQTAAMEEQKRVRAELYAVILSMYSALFDEYLLNADIAAGLKEATKRYKEYTEAVNTHGIESDEANEKEEEWIRTLDMLTSTKIPELINKVGLLTEEEVGHLKGMQDQINKAHDLGIVSDQEWTNISRSIREKITGSIIPDYQEMYRQGQIISDQVIEPEIKVDTGPAMTALAGLKELLSQIKSKNITITSSYAYSTVKTAMGGIVGYAGGGVVGNDGARQPILSAAYGMITPQTGREIPIMAHEYEIVANTSQQRNLAEWIMGKANSRPDNNMSGQPITIRNVLELDGQIIYEKTSEYLYNNQQLKSRGAGYR